MKSQVDQRFSSTTTTTTSNVDSNNGNGPKVLTQHIKKTQVVTLNRIQALNALDLDMVRIMTPLYEQWKNDASVQNIILKGQGSKAFCAGGDIKAIAETRDPTFFEEEYRLNLLIGTYPKPHIALLNGITMGGGVGLSVHGKFRIATENTVFAMPESQIGFFCDVGGSYFLPRLPGALGMYLALTGGRLKGKEVTAAGIATHYVESTRLVELEQALINLETSNETIIADTIAMFSTAVPSIATEEGAALLHHKADIDRIFSKGSVQDIVNALQQEQEQKDKGEWARKTLQAMQNVSPTSLRIIHRQLKIGKLLPTLKECLHMELGIAKQMMATEKGDFFEGVRALLVDKDKKFNWTPSTIAEVKREQIDLFFDDYLHLLPEGEKY